MNHGDQGFGLIATKDFEFDESLRKKLFGFLEFLDTTDFEEMKEKNYPSLFAAINGRSSILAGPLSLVNHTCKPTLKFGRPRLIAKRGSFARYIFFDFFCYCFIFLT